MRNWIAGAIAVLGTLLVLGGAATTISRLWFNRPAPDETAPTTPAYGAAQGGNRWFSRLSPPDRLILWGIVLLALAAVVTGAIGIELGANAPAK